MLALFAYYNKENPLASQFVPQFITDLTYLSIIAVQGDKAETFLQGQLTCNMLEVTEQQTRLAAHCNPKGRVIASFRVFKAATGYCLQAPAAMLPIIIPELNKYAVFSKVKLSDVSEQIVSIGYGGEFATKIIEKLIDKNLAVDQAAIWENCTITRIHSVVPRFIIIGKIGDVEKIKNMLAAKAARVSTESWQLLDIWSGIAAIEPITSGLFTPHMLNYPALNAVSFNKGCYIGQEIIARTHYLGKSKREMCAVVMPAEKNFSAGDKVYNEQQQEIGIIVNCGILNDAYVALVVFSPVISSISEK